MGKLADFLVLANAAFGRFASTPLTVRSHADENAVAIARMGASDGLVVELAPGSVAPLPNDAATQTTLAAVLAKIIAAPATETTVDEVTGASVAASATGEITKSDTTVYSPPLKAIWATGAGVITVMLADDTTSVIALTVAANERITFLRVKKVMSTGTTATGISGAS